MYVNFVNLQLCKKLTDPELELGQSRMEPLFSWNDKIHVSYMFMEHSTILEMLLTSNYRTWENYKLP